MLINAISCIQSLSHHHILVQAALNGILDGIQSIFGSTLTKIKSEITTTLHDAGFSLSTDQQQLMDKVINNAADPFEGIGTRYLQDKYIQEHLDYLVSI